MKTLDEIEKITVEGIRHGIVIKGMIIELLRKLLGMLYMIDMVMDELQWYLLYIDIAKKLCGGKEDENRVLEKDSKE